MRGLNRPLLAILPLLVSLSGSPWVMTQESTASSALPKSLLTVTPVPPEAEDSPTSYESPTYGFSVSWDDNVWNVDESATLVADGSTALDRLRLVTGAGPALYVEGADYGDTDAASCVTAESARNETNPGRSEYRAYVLPDGSEMAGEADGVAFAAFQFRVTPESGDPYDGILYINCRLQPGSGASILFTLFTRLDQFEPYLAEAETVIDSLTLPAAASLATPTAQLDVEAWFAAQVEAATTEPSLVGPLSGELVHSMDQVSLALAAAHEQSFYIRARFQSPEDTDAPSDFGIQFRSNGREFYRLVIDSASNWVLWQGTEFRVDSGTVTSLATHVGATNSLELVAIGDVGAFRLNGEEIGGPLDLSALSSAGQVSVGAAFSASTTVQGAITNYRDVEVWSLPGEEAAAPAEPTQTTVVPTDSMQTAVAARTPTPTVNLPTIPVPPILTPTVAPAAEPTPTVAPSPTLPTPTMDPGPTPIIDMAWFDAQVAAATAEPSLFGPADGELRHSMEQVSQHVLAPDVENFYLRADFENPADGATTMWDMGVSFRVQSGPEHYRLVIDSTSRWRLVIGNDSLQDIGSVATLDTAAEATNTLELVVVGTVGAFRLNGEELVGPLDLSAISGPGGLLVGAAYATDSTIEGGVTRFRDLQAWPLATAAPVEFPEAEPTTTPAGSSVPSIPDAPTAEPTASIALIPTQTATGSYESSRYGYSLTWDPSWIEVVRFSDSTDDTLGLTNTASLVGIIGSTKDGANALACRERAVRDYTSSVGNLSSVLADGQPLAGGDELRTWGVYRFTTGEGVQSVAYFECRAIPSEEATVLIAMTTTEEAYNTQALVLASLLENLVLP